MKTRRNQKGFTLMELMVVIVIVAILAAVAVPLYINYVNDAKRSEAKGAIAAIITAEQVYYQGGNPAQTSGLYVDWDGTTEDILKVDLGEDVLRNWGFTVTGSDGDGFLVTATGQATAADLGVTCQYSRADGPTWTDTHGAP